MSTKWSLFNSCAPTDVSPNIKARCVRCYGVPSQNNKQELSSFECVFHDEEGTRFEGTVSRFSIEKFKSLLQEGITYSLKKIVVQHNTNKYRTTAHNYKVSITAKTDVQEVVDADFPKFIYSFKTFEEILAMKDIATAVPFDVIGRVTHSSNVLERIMRNGSQKRLINLELEDLEGKRLGCTLWEEYADECWRQLEEKKQSVNIIILQLCRATIYQGAVKVQNGYHHTKILVNVDLPEMNEFKQRIVNDSSLSTTINSSTSHAANSGLIDEISSGLSSVICIKELSVIGDGENGKWFYISCKKCHKKLIKEKNRFYCRNCSTYTMDGGMRYKLIIHVGDESGSSPFLVWDKECMQVIGKSAAEFNFDVKEGTNDLDVPEEIENAFLRKRFMLKIKVQGGENRTYNSPHSVSILIDDPNIISTYSTKLLDSQESNTISVLESSNVVADNMFGNSAVDSDAIVEVGSGLLEEKTLKRSLLDEFSSTAKKTKVFIKQEKD
ncbi:hypothetical protein C2S52_022340 [Perilla frutescens var. hirtella]|nr:hypothetical protein C2S52_022340 [Perilla frutescens var. hirtella]